MRATLFPFLASLTIVTSAGAQTSDFPGVRDLVEVRRPADSLLLGAMHIDNDEYAVPVGPVERQERKIGKSVTVTGSVDVLAYAGPRTASSLTTYTGLASQLTAAGYTPVWTCVRATCGGPYDLMNLLAKPLIDTVHDGTWGGWIIEDLYTSNEDVRYGAFRKGGEYILVAGVLAPGHPSGALVIRLNGPAGDSVLKPAAAN